MQENATIGEVTTVSLDAKELARFRRTADINEIAMMFGRYVTLMDEMDAMSIY